MVYDLNIVFSFVSLDNICFVSTTTKSHVSVVVKVPFTVAHMTIVIRLPFACLTTFGHQELEVFIGEILVTDYRRLFVTAVISLQVNFLLFWAVEFDCSS